MAGPRRGPAAHYGARLLTGPLGRAGAFAIEFVAALTRAARGRGHPDERR